MLDLDRNSEDRFSCSAAQLVANRPVHIDSRVYVVNDAIKCSFEYLSVVHQFNIL